MRRSTPTLVTALLLLAGPQLTGCEEKSDALECLAPGQATALAAGVRSNSPTPALSEGIWDLLDSAVTAEKQITVVRLDGDPKKIFDRKFDPNAESEEGKKDERNAFRQQLSTVLNGSGDPQTEIKSQSPEVDVLGALTIAANATGPGGNVILIDSGLQTTAPLDFRDGSLLSAQPDTIVEYLKKNDLLPDLKGKHVYLGGLGATADPQDELDNRLHKRVMDLWSKIVDASGPACTYVDPNDSTLAAPAGRPQVGKVMLPALPPPPGACTETSFGEREDVGFIEDSAEFRDPKAAKAALKKLADVMVRESDQSAQLTGATSSEGSEAHNQQLSQQRAEAVEKVLVEFGVPESRITAKGVGEFLPGRVDDLGPDGRLDIGKAIQNRKVVAKLSGKQCPN